MLGVPRDTTLGGPLQQEGLAEVAGVAGHWCHCATDPKEGRTTSPLSASPSQAFWRCQGQAPTQLTLQGQGKEAS